jgi:hypothetical protein
MCKLAISSQSFVIKGSKCPINPTAIPNLTPIVYFTTDENTMRIHESNETTWEQILLG